MQNIFVSEIASLQFRWYAVTIDLMLVSMLYLIDILILRSSFVVAIMVALKEGTIGLTTRGLLAKFLSELYHE